MIHNYINYKWREKDKIKWKIIRYEEKERNKNRKKRIHMNKLVTCLFIMKMWDFMKVNEWQKIKRKKIVQRINHGKPASPPPPLKHTIWKKQKEKATYYVTNNENTEQNNGKFEKKKRKKKRKKKSRKRVVDLGLVSGGWSLFVFVRRTKHLM